MTIEKKRRRAAPAQTPKKVESLKDLLKITGRRKPRPIQFERCDIIDARALSCGERERLIALIEGKCKIGLKKHEKEEARCAAAYIAARLGVNEALPALKSQLAGNVESQFVRYSFELAARTLELMAELNLAQEASEQLPRLLDLRISGQPAEQRFADLVIRKADIKLGSVCSW